MNLYGGIFTPYNGFKTKSILFMHRVSVKGEFVLFEVLHLVREYTQIFFFRSPVTVYIYMTQTLREPVHTVTHIHV